MLYDHKNYSRVRQQNFVRSKFINNPTIYDDNKEYSSLININNAFNVLRLIIDQQKQWIIGILNDNHN